MYANKLKRFLIAANADTCRSEAANLCDAECSSLAYQIAGSNKDTEFAVHDCSVITEGDIDLGEVHVFDAGHGQSQLPSQRIESELFAYLYPMRNRHNCCTL